MKQILYVDNNPITTSAFQRQLEPHNTQVVMVTSGAEAITRAQATPPDVIVTDLQLPDMDGIALMAHLQNNPNTAHIPVVILTNHVSSRTRRYAEQMGCRAYLLKPVSRAQLSATFEQLLA
jgi:CheY-like chemotaxis protein